MEGRLKPAKGVSPRGGQEPGPCSLPLCTQELIFAERFAEGVPSKVNDGAEASAKAIS